MGFDEMGSATQGTASGTRSKTTMNRIVIGFVTIGLVGGSVVASGEEAAPYTVEWKSGLRLESADKAFKIRFGGRLQYDWTWASEDNRIREEIGELKDGSETRRARLYVSGTLYEVTDFKLQFDWAGGDSQLKDGWLGLNNLPVYVKIGHFKEPFSLEELTSSKYVTFMERTPVVTAFAPSRNAGIGISSTAMEKHMTWAIGGFRITDNQGSVIDDDSYSGAARVTGTPFYDDSGKRLLHFGGSGGFRKLPGAIRFNARPPIHNTDQIIDSQATVTDPVTGEEMTMGINGDDAWSWGLESAFVQGPISIQGEVIWAYVDVTDGTDFDGVGWYAQVSYFLTGEHRPYNQKSGAFGGVKPNENYGKGGRGAWEVAARYDWLDLTDAEAVGGELQDVSIGINWYLNPAVRLSANYIYTDREDLGEVQFVGGRAQVAF